MSAFLASTITTKGQATIPAKIRAALHLKVGDKILFKLGSKEKVIVTKLEPFDHRYHAALSASLNEWDSKEDDEAYHDL